MLGLVHEDNGIMKESVNLLSRDYTLLDIDIDLIRRIYESEITASNLLLVERSGSDLLRVVTFTVKE